MKRHLELLAPGGDIDSIKAAIVAGADAIYCGLNNFNARNRATNIELDDLNGILNLAHRNACKVFLTLNIIIVESEIKALFTLLNKLVNMRIDGIIVQDLGLLYLLGKHFKSLPIHASTQLTTHNEGQIKFLSKLAATRVNLSRELNINEIHDLTRIGHENNLSSEVFVHGSNCISFSGICYISSVQEGKSGNRGRCSQPCREQYLTTPEGMDFPLNLKDNSAYNDLDELHAAGVDSLKIEGRIKKFHYVYTVVNAWRKLLDNFSNQHQPHTNDSELYQVFNRDFTNAFLKGDINKNMYIDNPRDNSARHFFRGNEGSSAVGMHKIKDEIHATRTQIITQVKQQIDAISIEKSPLYLRVSGAAGTPLSVSITTVDTSFVVSSESNLLCTASRKNKSQQLAYASLYQRFKPINETEFCIQELDLENLQGDLFLPFQELTSLRNSILFTLNGAKEKIEPVALPRLTKPHNFNIQPTLSVLISSRQDLALCRETTADIYFQLPSCFADDYAEWVELFNENQELTPWFPAVLIGKNYTAAVEILERVKPQRIVTNNTGIAYAADEAGISWIAGPYLNCVNSFSLLCLKEKFNCSGAFISNEINRDQIRNIAPPDNFKLYYSIYHPILLLTSRQCLLQQIDGCEKTTLDEDCLQNCNKSSSLTNAKNVNLFVNKTAGYYHRIFNNHNFLNTEIVTDLPGMFSSLFIDLCEVKTETRITADKLHIIRIFENLLKGDMDSQQELEKVILLATQIQYSKGI